MIDLVIVSLIHQDASMLYWMMENIRKYVHGNFVWVIHFNGSGDIDTSRLPEWVWLVPNPGYTQTYTPSIAYAIAKCISYAASKSVFRNVLTLSSGSAFFRHYDAPKTERVQFSTYDTLFNGNCLRHHNQPIPINMLGKCCQYLKHNGYEGTWQFEGFDQHTEIHAKLLKRGFKWICGSQWSGQLIPYIPAIQFAADMPSNGPSYVAEEVLLSTYSYNYASLRDLPIWNSEAIIKWGPEYLVQDVKTVEIYRYISHTFPGIGHVVCKIPDDPNHPVRVFLNAT